MDRLYKILFVIILFLAAENTFAQKVLVRGRVMDTEAGEPIIGGTIVEQDQQQRIIKGTVTNVNGDYSIQVSSPNATLVFSSIGYKSEKVELNGRTTLNISLESDLVKLEEVQVVAERGYSDPITNIAERDKTGSSVKLDLIDATTAGLTSVEDAMQGQMSGVDIIGSGDPGSGGSIVIRGLSTLGNSEPLLVVDDTELECKL